LRAGDPGGQYRDQRDTNVIPIPAPAAGAGRPVRLSLGAAMDGRWLLRICNMLANIFGIGSIVARIMMPELDGVDTIR
jgi:hypothetical protein